MKSSEEMGQAFQIDTYQYNQNLEDFLENSTNNIVYW
jgi:hypothetical protein